MKCCEPQEIVDEAAVRIAFCGSNRYVRRRRTAKRKRASGLACLIPQRPVVWAGNLVALRPGHGLMVLLARTTQDWQLGMTFRFFFFFFFLCPREAGVASGTDTSTAISSCVSRRGRNFRDR